nr:hypothetical protein [Shigella sonnei]
MRFIQHISGKVVCFRHPLTGMFKAFSSQTHLVRASLHILNLPVSLFCEQTLKSFCCSLMLAGNSFDQRF